MKEYDVVVIGAGPAGLQCARELAQKNINVIVLEKQKEIGEPNFSTAGTPEETIEVFGFPKEVAPYECNKMYFKTPNEEKVFNLNKHKLYVLDFRKLRQWLAQEVAEKGGRLSVDTTVKDLIIEKDQVMGVDYQGLISNGQIKAKIVVDASGILGILSKQLKIFDPKKSIRTLAIEMEMTNISLPYKNAIYIYIGNEFIPNGYAWVFPLSDKAAKIGLARIFINNIHFDLEMGLKKFIESIPWLNQAQPLEFHTGSFVANYSTNTTRNGYMAIGSAAGHLNAVAGEGIRHALYGGKFAAQVIQEALKKNNFSEKQLSKFNEIWKNYSKDDWKICRKISQYIYSDTQGERMDHFLKELEMFSGDDLYDMFFNYNLKPYLEPITGHLALEEIKKVKELF